MFFNKAYEVSLRPFKTLKPMNNYVTYFFGFSNGFSNQSGAREISRLSLVLMLEGPWIYSRNFTTHLIFGNSRR
jgi:hypothetical protein